MAESRDFGKKRGWVFTINNYQDVDMEKIKKNLSGCQYWMMGNEVGEEGTPHKQGWLYCKNPVVFNTVRLWFLNKAHIEPMKGLPSHNVTYCTKDGDFEEYGKRPMDQKAKGIAGKEQQEAKWKRIDELARKGEWETLADEFPREHIVHLRNLRMRHQLAIDSKEDAKDVTGIWFHGESGAGKSHRARHYSEKFYIKGINKWWDGYEGEDTVIIEDVSDKHEFLGDFLKIWADKWAFTAEVKGASLRKIRPGTLIVTSQYRIDEIFKDDRTRVALERRFKQVEVKRGPLEDAFEQCAQEIELSPLPDQDDFNIGFDEEEGMSDYEKKLNRKRKREEIIEIE